MAIFLLFAYKNNMNIYNKLTNEIKLLQKTTSWFSIGKSVLGKNIICFKLGNGGGKTLFLQGAIHAREYITSFLLIEIIKYLKLFYFSGTVYIVPLANPDGVDICINGTKNIKNKSKKELVEELLKYGDKVSFKANARGVDLNTNFNANWGKGKYNNLIYPACQNFVGFKPNSEPETKALINLTEQIKPNLTLSYHSKGEIVFWGYKGQSNKTILEQKKYLNLITKVTGYKARYTKNSSGGYKDYCLLNLNIVGFTIEVGNDNLSHPINLKHLKKIFLQHKDLVLLLLKV